MSRDSKIIIFKRGIYGVFMLDPLNILKGDKTAVEYLDIILGSNQNAPYRFGQR